MTMSTPQPTYRPPAWVRRVVVNPVARLLLRRGRAGGRGEQNRMRVLRVTGRSSGRPYDVPLRIAVRDGHRYVVSLTGQTEWARNLRAAGGGALVYGTRSEAVTAVELDPAEAVDFLRWYCTVAEHRLSVRAGLRLSPPHPAEADLVRAAGLHPVFRLSATRAA